MSMNVAGVGLPIPFQVSQVVIDVPWASARPGFDAGTSHTLRGGNLDFSTVATSQGFRGPSISYFTCQSKGHALTYYEQISGS